MLLKVLAKRPEDRYQTAAEFAHTLSAVAASEAGLETRRPAIPQAEEPITPVIPSSDSGVPEWFTREEAARAVAPPSGQAADAKKHGIDTRLIVGGVGALALCLCAWFGVSLYAYSQMAGPITFLSELSTPSAAREPSLVAPTLLALTSGVTSEPEAVIWFWSADYSPDGKHIVTSHDDNTVRVWDAATGKQLTVQPGRGETREAMYSPDGTRVLTTDGNSENNEYYASVWDATLEKELLRLTGHTSHLFRARFDPQGKQIATASEDGTARIWDAATGTQRLFLVQHDYWILDPVYSPDGKQLATQAESGYLEIWDAETGKKLASFSAWSPRYSPDSKRIVMTRDDNTAWVWGTATWTKLIVLSGHTDAIWGASYSPNGKQIVTGAKTGQHASGMPRPESSSPSSTVTPVPSRLLSTARIAGTSSPRPIDPARVWNARTGEPVATLGSKSDGVDVAVFSPDGRQLFTGNEDGTAHVWDTATWRELVEWTTRAQLLLLCRLRLRKQLKPRKTS